MLTVIPEVDGERLLIGSDGNHIKAETQLNKREGRTEYIETRTIGLH